MAVTLRFSKAKIKKWVKDGIFEKKAADKLIENMATNMGRQMQPDPAKQNSAAAGVSTDSKGNKIALVYQVWTKLKIRGEMRMMVTHFGGRSLSWAASATPTGATGCRC